MTERKLFIYIACSLDGYIAAPNDDLSFLDPMDQEGEDYGYVEFISKVDTVILGRKTYDWVLKHAPFPHSDKEAYIITRTPRAPEGNITFYTGILAELVETLKAKPGKHIFCDGGAEVIHTLLMDNLVDEFIIAVIPVLLGNGISLFKEGRGAQNLELLSAKSYPTGLVQLHYKKQS